VQREETPGPAGWGGRFLLAGKKVFEIGGRKDHATNNQMELTAPIEALKYVKKYKTGDEVEIVSDSKYVIWELPSGFLIGKK